MTMDAKKIAELREYFDTHELGPEDFDKMVPVDPTPSEHVMVTYSLRLPKTVMDEVRKQAKACGVKPTALMRRWVEERALATDSADAAVPMDRAEITHLIREAVRVELNEAGLRHT